MDQVFVEGLRLFAPVGVSEAERAVGCWIELDVRATLSGAAHRDALEATLDYRALAEACGRAVAEPTKTLEAVCCRVAEAVLAMPGVAEAEVEARKPAPPADLHGVVGARVVRRLPRPAAP
jgi:dihydroneopterin aldolase